MPEHHPLAPASPWVEVVATEVEVSSAALLVETWALPLSASPPCALQPKSGRASSKSPFVSVAKTTGVATAVGASARTAVAVAVSAAAAVAVAVAVALLVPVAVAVAVPVVLLVAVAEAVLLAVVVGLAAVCVNSTLSTSSTAPGRFGVTFTRTRA